MSVTSRAPSAKAWPRIERRLCLPTKLVVSAGSVFREAMSRPKITLLQRELEGDHIPDVDRAALERHRRVTLGRERLEHGLLHERERLQDTAVAERAGRGDH